MSWGAECGREHACLLQTGYGQRVAAAQAEVGVLGDVRELVDAVAERLGYGLAVLSAGVASGRAIVLADLVVDLGRIHVLVEVFGVVLMTVVWC